MKARSRSTPAEAGVAIRSARTGDAPRLAALSAELGYPATVGEIERRLPPLLTSSDHLLLVAADRDDQAVGWLHAAVHHQLENDPFVHVAGLVVAAGRRGAGIGSRLLSHAERWALQIGVRTVRVRSNVVRERAHGFYLRAGYTLAKTSHLFVKELS